MNTEESILERLSRLTLEQKVRLVAGESDWRTHAIKEAGIPILKVSDGPNGVRGDGGVAAACFPVGICMASTWDLALLKEIGGAIAEEAKTKGVQVVLGPTINIHRTPLGGRNFECYSEDPLLSGELASAFTQGVQDKGVGACLKHFVCNDSEFERHSLSIEVDERTLREVYLRPFEIAIKKSRPWTVMAAYNRINGIYACSHDRLINQVLKREWGFEGLVVSDWYAAKETTANALGGLDLEMPGPAISFGSALLGAVNNGQVDESIIDDKVKRLLRVLSWSGKFENPATEVEIASDQSHHRNIAYRAATEGMVLLKNNGLLPLVASDIKTLAVIGPNAKSYRIMGGGSSALRPHYISDPIESLAEGLPDTLISHHYGCHTFKYIPAPNPLLLSQNRNSPGANSQQKGLRCEFYENFDDTDAINERRISTNTIYVGGLMQVGQAASAAKISGYYHAEASGEYEFGLFSTGQVKLSVNGKLLINNWDAEEIAPGDAFFQQASAEKRAKLFLEKDEYVAISILFENNPNNSIHALRYGILPPQIDDPIAEAVAIASQADHVILLVGTNDDWETEGNDREMLELPGEQNRLIEALVAVNANTVIVNNSGSPISMPWAPAAPAIIQSWFAGQEFGNALRDILLGRVNPSGKLPITFPERIEDTPAYTSYPGEFGKVHYGEGIFVGYRWYGTRGLRPLFPFGHGLSYTEFRYEKIRYSQAQRRLSVTLSNSGELAGKETIQVYGQALNPGIARPKYQLLGFQKVYFEAGQTKEVHITLDDMAFSYWHCQQEAWQLEAGRYRLFASRSAADHCLSVDVNIAPV